MPTLRRCSSRQRLSKFFIASLKLFSLPVAWLRLVVIEVWSILRSRGLGLSATRASSRRVFNLDLHVAVVPDFSSELARNGARLTRFSISSHNHLFRGWLAAPDPVRHVNQWNWMNLDSKSIEAFRSRYGSFLKSFDGFLFTHTPAFVELVSNLTKPALVVAATRYEVPHTANRQTWAQLNEVLVAGHDSGWLTVIANNKADADYLNFFTGIAPAVLPSICPREPSWTGSIGRRVVIARDPELKKHISEVTGGVYEPSDSLGTPYRWKDLVGCSEVLVIPQNVSTMTLFELATAGVPVAIPDRQFLVQLRKSYRGVLDELTYAEMGSLDLSSEELSPINWKSEHYLDWWLDRADFFNRELMPNVKLVSSWEELLVSDAELENRGAAVRKLTRRRNLTLQRTRDLFIRGWVDSLA